MTTVAPCRGCGAKIVWRKTPAGLWMALDPESVTVRLIPAAEATEEDKAAGARRTLVTDAGRTVLGYEYPWTQGPLRGELVTGRVPHWASCSQAKAFRRR